MAIDLIVVAVLLISAAVSFFRGFIREVLTIFGLGGAAAGAFVFGHMAVPTFQGWMVDTDDPDYKYFGFLPADLLASVVAYAAVFILIFLALAILSHFLSKGAEALGLGPVDRALGVVFGLIRGFLIVSIVFLSFSIFIDEGEEPEFMTDSKLVPVIDSAVDGTLDMLGLEKPLQGDDVDEDAVKKSFDAIDKVREDYIDPDKKKSVNTKDGTGYKAGERDALGDLIDGDLTEKDAVKTGGNQ